MYIVIHSEKNGFWDDMWWLHSFKKGPWQEDETTFYNDAKKIWRRKILKWKNPNPSMIRHEWEHCFLLVLVLGLLELIAKKINKIG